MLMDYNNQNIEWMKVAFREAEKAFQCEEVPIGAVVVKDGKIVGRGYNQTETLKDGTAHAEMIAITSAASSIGDWRLDDCILYVTKEPCLMCAGAIVNSRIKMVFFLEPTMKDMDAHHLCINFVIALNFLIEQQLEVV